MQPLKLKAPEPSAEAVESWDDDGDLEGFDDVQLRAASTTTSVTSSSAVHHRDSISSRLSARSELDSSHGDEDWQVLVDEGKFNTQDAIASAKAKGIPIPENVPQSALLGGTIRRLGGKKIQKAMTDDWSEDLDFPGTNAELKLAKTDENDFAESLRQISAAFRKNMPDAPASQTLTNKTVKPRNLAPTINLDSFKDNDDDDAFGDVPTIKVQKNRAQVKPLSLVNTSTPKAPTSVPKEAENLEDDFELPSDGKLVLSKRREHPRTPHQDDDIDIEWAEGSLGTRHGGTRREGRSGRSSSISALSPSVSSCLTGESEDEGLDGLVLPDAPLEVKLEQVMKIRQENASPEASIRPSEHPATKRTADKDEDWTGLDFGDGDVFDSQKLTLNRNIKHKVERPKSPSRRTQTALTFTSKTSQTFQHPSTRIPRPHHVHDRPRSTLEPVSETGQPLPRTRRPESKLGHTAQSSVSSLPTPTTPSTPSTPSRRGLNPTPSRDTLRHEPPTTTSAQLLRAKRSMPAMRVQSPSKPPPYPRPPSRNEGASSRLHMTSRPKTPTSERSESRLEALRRPPVPFLPGGNSQAQSHHVSVKSTRQFKRNDSEGSLEGGLPGQRPTSRLANIRPETPGRRKNIAPAELALNAKRPITKPTKRRNFGDGSELEIFDDLPTSATMESRFVKQPIGKGQPRLRNMLGQSLQNPSVSSITTTMTIGTRSDRTETPMPSTPLSPTKHDHVPSFARDTAASRNAREQRQASMHVNSRDNLRDAPSGPLAPLSTNWRSRLAGLSNISQTFRRKNKEPQKPQLIKPLGDGVNEAKTVKGMHYNPLLFRWEGNENVLTSFDTPIQPALLTPTSPKPAPALITNVGSLATGVQISGGMIFDPQRMCWLKMAPSQQRDSSNPNLRGGVGSVQLEEEEDVFAGLDDLREEDEGSRQASLRKVSGDIADRTGATDETTGGGDSSDEGFQVVSEEFDVGPEFIRRQRAEEEKWRRKTDRWMRSPEEAEAIDANGRVDWRWAIRGLAMAG